MQISPTKLRQNLYSILDAVLESGVPVEIKRRGRLLRIVPVEDPEADRLGRLRRIAPRPDLMLVDPEELVGVDWSDLWSP